MSRTKILVSLDILIKDRFFNQNTLLGSTRIIANSVLAEIARSEHRRNGSNGYNGSDGSNVTSGSTSISINNNNFDNFENNKSSSRAADGDSDGEIVPG